MQAMYQFYGGISMDKIKRQVIDVNKEHGESKELELTELNADGQTRRFRITHNIGSGTTALVYEAEYLSGGLWHQCVLKELYPEDYGLVRDRNTEKLMFDEKKSDIEELKQKYEVYKKRYLEAYRIQNEMKRADLSQLNGLQDKMMLAVSVSTPLGVYENEYGILYTVYESSSGIAYDEFNTEKYPVEESLFGILDVIIQTGNTIDAFHRAGYLVLDIKEKNILITGNDDNRTAMQFDFGSFVKKEELKNFKFNSDIVLSFTSQDSAVLLPKELRTFHSYYENNKKSAAERIVQTTLAETGEKIDVFLLAVILFRRLFGFTPTADLVKEDGKWELPEKSKYISMPLLLEKLHNIFNKALAKLPGRRYETMAQFVNDLKDLRTFSHLENPEDIKRYKENGIEYTESTVTKGMLKAYSRKQWENLSSEGGKFTQLVKFSDRFDCKISLADKNDKLISPNEAIENSNRVILFGDGGMGKSTAVFDYWTEQLTTRKNCQKICLYIDLSHFSSIRIEVREYSDNHGNFNSDIPLYLLAYMETEILQRYSITSKVVMPGAGLSDEAKFTQLTALQQMLSLNTDYPEFLIFLDGFNEILDKADKGAFENDLEKAVKTWRNASIVVTSRVLSDNSKSGFGKPNEKDIFDEFDSFKFVGISEKEIEKAILENKKIDAEKLNKLKKDRLWEILKIPMFLNMYLNLHTGEKASIHTRGELLDNFIMQKEIQTALRISKESKGRDYVHANLRSFIVLYSLPFAANMMDAEKSFSSSEPSFWSQVTTGNLLYLIQTVGSKHLSVYKNVTRNIIKKSEIKFDDERFEFKQMKLHKSDEKLSSEDIEKYAMEDMISMDMIFDVLKEETHYCYDVSNSEIGFTHQYFRDYFVAKHIQNILNAAQVLGENGLSKDEQLQFTKNYGLDYTWSDDVCILLGEIIGDYKNEPGYTEE